MWETMKKTIFQFLGTKAWSQEFSLPKDLANMFKFYQA
jgi:hypothetical protein